MGIALKGLSTSSRGIAAVRSSTPTVTLEACVDYFLESEERRDIDCASCTIANVEESFPKEQSSTSANNTSNIEELPLKMRFLSPSDSHIVDLDDDDLAEKISHSHRRLFDRLWGHLKPQYIMKQSMIYSASFARFPSLLCFHISRHIIDFTGQVKKDDTRVKFPIILDMNKYVAVPEGNGKLNTHKGSNKCQHEFVEANCIDGTRSTDTDSSHDSNGSSGNNECRRIPIATYLLRAVVVHFGSKDGGHYTAYCLVQESPTRKWAYFSDEKVEYVEESRVLSSQAFMLFYDRTKQATIDSLYS